MGSWLSVSVSTAAGLSSIGDYIFRAGLATDKMNPAGVASGDDYDSSGREMGLTPDAQYIVPELSMNEVAMAGALRKGQLPLRVGTACRTIR